MSGAPKVRSMNVAEFGPAGNKAAGSLVARKPASKGGGGSTAEEKKKVSRSPSQSNHNVPSILRKSELLFHLSLDASCSSDASTESLYSRGSTGRLTRSFSTSSARPRSSSAARQRKQCVPKPEKVGSNSDSVSSADNNLQTKKRCGWVTPNTDPCYATFHDEEWGVPVHDDKKLFELLVLSGALAEHTWPTILNKRHLFREVFADFDPIVISKLNEKKIIAPGSIASSLLSELKLRAVIDNARQISKIIDEFGSFDNYIWSFVNHKPIVSKFCYPRQVPVKTPKADVISKDLVRRGFRSVGPTVMYSFMQVAGITNDHVISCFRFQECLTAATGNKQDDEKVTTEEKKLMQVDGITNDHVYCFESEECLAVVGRNREDDGKSKTEDAVDLGIAKVMDELSIMDNLTLTPESRVHCHEEKGLVWQVK